MSDMRISAGTVESAPHRENNQGNQDSFAYLQENGYTVIAVADGDSSLGENSVTGASIAAATSVEETLDSLIAGNDIDEALHRGIEASREVLLSRDDRDTLGCTLSLAVKSHSSWGVALVGDAFAVVSQAEDDHTLICRNQDSSNPGNPKLLTDEAYEPLFMYGEGDIQAIAVSSDGLAGISLNISEKQVSHDFWAPLVQQALEGNLDIQNFLNLMDQESQLQDDTTLVIASSKV